MGDVAIKAEGLGKRYRIGAVRERYHTLRDAIVNVAKAPVRLLSRLGGRSEKNTIWALKDVSFEVKRGEVVGVIGRNGAGKTTLLKILSRITKPTEGRAEILGRVGSLLEVGTGFHPELTGRENIFLNGSILGMRRREIKARFDEIVAFAEVEKFMDTPVKRYSSGMQVRLAFAVAAHLEPEILLVDEVLAVGDAQFQKKCLGKMGEVAKEGRTVLFVSHNMGAVRALCPRAMILEAGRIALNGTTEEAIGAYLPGGAEEAALAVWVAPQNDSTDRAEVALRSVSAVSVDGEPQATYPIEESFGIVVRYRVLRQVSDLRLVLQFQDMQGTVAFTSHEDSSLVRGREVPPGTYEAVCRIPGSLLNSVSYSVLVSIDRPRIRLIHPLTKTVTIQMVETSYRFRYPQGLKGVVRPTLEWTTRRMGDDER